MANDTHITIKTNKGDSNMSQIKDISIQSDNDSRKVLISRKGDNLPPIDLNTKQKFLELVKPLNLQNPDEVFLQVHQIAYGEMIDANSLSEYLRPNDCDEDIMRFFQMMLSINGYEDIEGIRIGVRLKGKEEIQSYSFDEQDFAKAVIPAIYKCCLKTFAPTRCVRSYIDQKLKSREIVKEEVKRLKSAKAFSKRHFQHRPSTNRRKYGLLLLFFDILKIERHKPNYSLLIDIMQLFNLWDNKTVNADSYKLVFRQLSTAKSYKLEIW
ncbi:MAG: hypothetical protein MJZ93_04400 [Paludibacteraceae bacterium]|nr:hypothetical protein [Paludibacteraceae bacterium]